MPSFSGNSRIGSKNRKSQAGGGISTVDETNSAADETLLTLRMVLGGGQVRITAISIAGITGIITASWVTILGVEIISLKLVKTLRQTGRDGRETGECSIDRRDNRIQGRCCRIVR